MNDGTLLFLCQVHNHRLPVLSRATETTFSAWSNAAIQ